LKPIQINGVLGSREKNKEEKKTPISMNKFRLKLDQIHLLESVFFSLLNLFLLSQAHPNLCKLKLLFLLKEIF
jgi:hypothetical protein